MRLQGYLLKICIPCSTSCSWDCPAEGASGGGDGLRRRQLLGAGGAGGAGGSRLLLASAAKDELACAEAAATCSVGSEPFWSSLAIIQVGWPELESLQAAPPLLLLLWLLLRGVS